MPSDDDTSGPLAVAMAETRRQRIHSVIGIGFYVAVVCWAVVNLLVVALEPVAIVSVGQMLSIPLIVEGYVVGHVALVAAALARLVLEYRVYQDLGSDAIETAVEAMERE